MFGSISPKPLNGQVLRSAVKVFRVSYRAGQGMATAAVLPPPPAEITRCSWAWTSGFKVTAFLRTRP